MQPRRTPSGSAKRQAPTSAGFSLLELLVALLVLSTTSLGLSYMAMMNTSGNTRSGDHAAAVALGTEKLETLKNEGFGKLVPGSDSDGPITSAGTDDSGGPFYRTWTIADTTLNGIDAKEVIVEVTWSGGGSVELATIVADIPEAVAGLPTAWVDGWNQVR